VVKGVSLLEDEQIKKIILPFQEHWLTKEEILEIIKLLLQVYEKAGYREMLSKISYRIEGNSLVFKVEEKRSKNFTPAERSQLFKIKK
jgi:hypothetical protein